MPSKQSVGAYSADLLQQRLLFRACSSGSARCLFADAPHGVSANLKLFFRAMSRTRLWFTPNAATALLIGFPRSTILLEAWCQLVALSPQLAAVPAAIGTILHDADALGDLLHSVSGAEEGLQLLFSLSMIESRGFGKGTPIMAAHRSRRK
ncbi:hypothetical protein V6L78_24495 [Pseudomonas canadensis]|uniref:hypothetical protein n=1 Tax=Pseudomonas canadensis TaxID=915099 RepID=UPI0030CCEC69